MFRLSIRNEARRRTGPARGKDARPHQGLRRSPEVRRIGMPGAGGWRPGTALPSRNFGSKRQGSYADLRIHSVPAEHSGTRPDAERDPRGERTPGSSEPGRSPEVRRIGMPGAGGWRPGTALPSRELSSSKRQGWYPDLRIRSVPAEHFRNEARRRTGPARGKDSRLFGARKVARGRRFHRDAWCWREGGQARLCRAGNFGSKRQG